MSLAFQIHLHCVLHCTHWSGVMEQHEHFPGNEGLGTIQSAVAKKLLPLKPGKLAGILRKSQANTGGHDGNSGKVGNSNTGEVSQDGKLIAATGNSGSNNTSTTSGSSCIMIRATMGRKETADTSNQIFQIWRELSNGRLVRNNGISGMRRGIRSVRSHYWLEKLESAHGGMAEMTEFPLEIVDLEGTLPLSRQLFRIVPESMENSNAMNDKKGILE